MSDITIKEILNFIPQITDYNQLSDIELAVILAKINVDKETQGCRVYKTKDTIFGDVKFCNECEFECYSGGCIKYREENKYYSQNIYDKQED